MNFQRIRQKNEKNALVVFAREHRLKTARQAIGEGEEETTIPGRQGQIYEVEEGQLAVLFSAPSKTDPAGRWCPKIWGNFKRAALPLGMVLLQNGDTEGCMSFNHKDKEQIKMALSIAKCRPKRAVSSERLAQMVATLAKARQDGKTTVKKAPTGSRIAAQALNESQVG